MIFEINKKQNKKNGYKNFKLSLLEIHSDDCVVDGIGTEYNNNGITWLEKYIAKYKNTLINTNVVVEFSDETKTTILGHGETGVFTIDGIPLLDNATAIGHFTNAYISEISDKNGTTKKILIGEGYLDYMRYPNCIDLLEEKLSNGETVYGSVEILKTGENNCIVYENGYKEFGRIPSEFEFSGFALLGIMPADYSAQLIELSALKRKVKLKEETKTMDEETLARIIASVKTAIIETNSKTVEYESTITELNSEIEKKKNETCELTDKIEKLQKALDDINKEQETFWEERRIIEDELSKVKVEKRLSEMDSALKNFTDSEKAYAQTEIDSFNKSPLTSEINSVVAKIYEGIGKAAVSAKSEAEKIISEQNSMKKNIDIFADVDEDNSDVSIDSLF